MEEREVRLVGGNVSEVWRVGDTVRRPTGPWTPTVHALLRHLEGAGYAGAPRALGVDRRDREVLTYLDGEVPIDPAPAQVWSDQTLVEVARLLRGLHDATAGFQPPAARWRDGAGHPGGGDVICHNDVAPYNTVFQAGRPTAFIDWDFAAPGPRAWDLAYAAYRFVSLSPDEPAAGLGLPLPVDRPARLRRFCDAYGLTGRAGLVDLILQRIQAVCDLIAGQAGLGNPAFQRHLAEGHLDDYHRDLEFVGSLRSQLEDNLG